MESFETGAVRDTGGKGRMDLIPWCAVIRVSKHMEDALTHYPERNWEKGLPMHTMIDSAFRHLAKYVDGWDDEDHLCAAATNLLMAMWTEEKKPDMRDVPTTTKHMGHCEDTNCPYFCPVDGRCEGSMERDVCYVHGDMNKCPRIWKENHSEGAGQAT